MTTKLKFLSSILIFLVSAQLFGQITIKSLPFDSKIASDSTLFGKSATRSVKLLNEGWKVFWESNPSNKISTTIPASFQGKESLVYETSIYLSKEDISNKSFLLGFFGAGYSLEILLNNISIYKRSGGETPFEIELPSDVLKPDAKNKISVKINSQLNSENTIPVKQRFLFPALQQGITRDVYLKTVPKTFISKLSVQTSIDANLAKAKIITALTFENFTRLKKLNEAGEQIKLRFILRPADFSGTSYSYETNISSFEKDEFDTDTQFEVASPALWSPENPNSYLCEVSILAGQQLIDSDIRQISFFKISVENQSVLLNNQPFVLKGTTYFLNETLLNTRTAYQRINDELRLIKETGFNAVRFSKAYPHPYALKICRELGLLALVELPLNSIPEELIYENEFQLRAVNRLKEMIDEYSHYSNAVIYGLGSGYLPDSKITEDFISSLAQAAKEKGFSTYASFFGKQTNDINDLDFYGIELFTRSTDDAEEFLSNIDGAKYFLSEINYPKYVGSASGYLVQNSEEAQAKYLENVIEISNEKKLGGFFVNTLFNYTGDHKSLYAAYSENNLYSLGIISGNRLQNSLPYKVLESKLRGEGKVTIPIGSSKDENKLMFILLALALSVIMAVLINTKKKFREDCTRALVRPYNFYADIRDHRILSSIHTFVLLLVETASASLFLAIILYYLRTNILFEKLLISFGNNFMIDSVSNLAWHPEKSFVYIFIALLMKIGILTLLIKLASFSIKTRVETASIFYSIVWAFLPFTLLLPVELILYKILAAYGMNIYALIFLIVFWLWIIQRIIKGIHVIFDVRPFPVYFYSLLAIILAVGGVFLYYQMTNSTLYYLTNAIKQYTSMSF